MGSDWARAANRVAGFVRACFFFIQKTKPATTARRTTTPPAIAPMMTPVLILSDPNAADGAAGGESIMRALPMTVTVGVDKTLMPAALKKSVAAEVVDRDSNMLLTAVPARGRLCTEMVTRAEPGWTSTVIPPLMM